ncbi:hypothetical protein TWF788_008424 [Orbilia oligospora]|uniref:Uncharacterized protein n=1 Tax=Orbilia oligospora TaxID=2813651 RepID=A0A7C8PHB0_ORBOL|nr:hypothetical protein TWF788_008424 [Orbilia oligospora]
MSSLSPMIRSIMWNIYIHTFKQTIVKPTRADAIAGFICSNGLSISTGTIFEDLKITYPKRDDDGFVEFIDSADEDREFEFKKPTTGCAEVPILKFDPEKNGYLPKEPSYHISPTRRSHTSSEDSASRPATPGSDELRQKEEQESREFARNNFDIDPKSFERLVKYAYTEYLITRTNSRCGPLLCGPGYAATHMVPPTLWFSYPDERPVEDFFELQ